MKLKRQEQINRRKAEAAFSGLSGIFDVKTDRLEDRLGKLPAKRKSKKSGEVVAAQPTNSEPNSEPEPESLSIVPSESVSSVVSSDFTSEADSIKQMHRELQALGLTMLDQMFRIGERLSRIKEQLPHGSWEQWVDEHLKFTTRTARRYLRAYKHRRYVLATSDPILFLEQIQGNAESQSDSKSKSDVNVRFGEGSPTSQRSRSRNESQKSSVALFINIGVSPLLTPKRTSSN